MEKRFVAPLTEPEQQTLTSAYHHARSALSVVGRMPFY